MKQSEASRHQPAGEPLSLQADAAGDMRGRQYAPYMRARPLASRSRLLCSWGRGLATRGSRVSPSLILAGPAPACLAQPGLMDSQSRCVVVTGFGPFRQHLVNSSWEAVKELSKLGLGMDTDTKLQTLQLPMDYREVRRRLTAIWEDVQPQLAVHVGMDTSTKAIFLEQCGKNQHYRDTDIRGFQPEGGVCVPGGPEVMLSAVSMKEVCRRVSVENVEVAFSRDAGRYTSGAHVPSRWERGNVLQSPSLSSRCPGGCFGCRHP
ncbi:pyroglutamyl-peptidase 1 [Sigmodon hispidus]